MNATQQAAIAGAVSGIETAAEVGVGVAAVADPRVGTAVQVAQLSLNLLATAQQLNQMGKMTDQQLIALWAQRGAGMAAEHKAIFGADPTVDSDPDVVANEAAAAAAAAPAQEPAASIAQAAPGTDPAPAPAATGSAS